MTAQTERSRRNFVIGADRFRWGRPVIRAFGIVKKAAALANLELGVGRNLVVGEVLTAHIRDELIDADKLRVHTERMRLIGRMHGTGWYARTTDLFEMPRLSLDEFRHLKAAAED